MTSCPRASSSTASALSREQLPQYMPAAPAVIERILMTAVQTEGSTVQGLNVQGLA